MSPLYLPPPLLLRRDAISSLNDMKLCSLFIYSIFFNVLIGRDVVLICSSPSNSPIHPTPDRPPLPYIYFCFDVSSICLADNLAIDDDLYVAGYVSSCNAHRSVFVQERNLFSFNKSCLIICDDSEAHALTSGRNWYLDSIFRYSWHWSAVSEWVQNYWGVLSTEINIQHQLLAKFYVYLHVNVVVAVSLSIRQENRVNTCQSSFLSHCSL